MPLTLAEMKAQMTDKVVVGVVDEFVKSDYLLQTMPFDNTAYLGVGGTAWTYGYNRVTTQPTASTRAVNTEYTPQLAKTTRYNVDLKILGGAADFDRALAGTGYVVDQVEFQLQQKIKATRSQFHDLVINGDTGGDANAFDGLNIALTGSTTEYNAGGANNIALVSSANADSNYKVFLDKMDEFLSLLDGTPNALIMGPKMFTKLQWVARRAAAYSEVRDTMGSTVSFYNGIPFVNLGAKPGVATSIVAENATRDTITGLADIYAVRFGLDGFHGIAPEGVDNLLRVYLPDMAQPGVVKKLETEMVTAIALKSTKAAGVFRNIKVQ